MKYKRLVVGNQYFDFSADTPDEEMLSEAKKEGLSGDYEIREIDEPETPSLTGQIGPNVKLPYASETPQGASPGMMTALADVAETGAGAASYGVPAALAYAFPGVGPVAMGLMQAGGYAGPAAIQRLIQSARGKTVTPTDIAKDVGGAIGMGLSGGISQFAPRVGEAMIRRGMGGVGATQLGIETGGNLLAGAVERGAAGRDIIPSGEEALFTAALSTLPARANVIQARSNVMAQGLDDLVAQLSVQMPGVPEPQLRQVAAMLSDDPVANQNLMELVMNDPSRIPDLRPAGRAIGQSGVRTLGSEQVQQGPEGIASPEDMAAQGYELKKGLDILAEKRAREAEEALKAGAEKVIGRPIDVTEAERAAAATALQTDVARGVAQELKAYDERINDVVQTVLEEVAPGVRRTEAIGGTARLGEAAIDKIRVRRNAAQAIKQTAWDNFMTELAQTPQVANRPLVLPGVEDRNAELQKIREMLAQYGSPEMASIVDLKNIANQFFPEDTNTVKTVGDYIRAMPALNAAYATAKNITDPRQASNKRNLLFALNQIRKRVETVLEPAMQESEPLRAAWMKARTSSKVYGDTDEVLMALQRAGPNKVGEQLTSMSIGAQPEDEFKNIYRLLGATEAKDLRMKETRNAIAQILHRNTDPKTGRIADPSKVLQDLYQQENKLGPDLYSKLARFLTAPATEEATSRAEALRRMINGDVISRVAQFDPDVVKFAESVNPQATAVAKAMGISNLLKKARGDDGLFDLTRIAQDANVQRILNGRLNDYPEIATLLSGAGATNAINQAQFVTEVLKRHPFNQLGDLYHTFLRSAEIGGPEVRAFKQTVLDAFPGPQGEQAWAELRNSFWQNQLFDPKTGEPLFDRWLIATEKGGYPREFLAEMAGAGTKQVDPKTGAVRVVTEQEAMDKVAEWTKNVRKLQGYADLFVSQDMGLSGAQIAGMKKARKDEDRAAFIGGTGLVASLGMYSAGALRYLESMLAKAGILEYWNGMRQARLFDSRRDHLTDKLAAMEKAFARSAQSLINSNLLRESGQEPPIGIPQPDK